MIRGLPCYRTGTCRPPGEDPARCGRFPRPDHLHQPAQGSGGSRSVVELKADLEYRLEEVHTCSSWTSPW